VRMSRENAVERDAERSARQASRMTMGVTGRVPRHSGGVK
jgi:hypothetical protein